MNAVELVAKLKATDQEPPRTYKADILAVNDFLLVLKALDAFLDSKTALRIACPTCTITLLEKGERQHEDDCPAWLAKEALATVAEHAQKALEEK